MGGQEKRVAEGSGQPSRGVRGVRRSRKRDSGSCKRQQKQLQNGPQQLLEAASGPNQRGDAAN